MVCAESSASFSNTAAFLMSSLGEATERVTSILVQQSGCGHWHDCRVGAQARSCLSAAEGTGRPAAAQRQPPALASGGTARLLLLLNGEQKWAVEGQPLQKNRIRRPGPERSPPGRRDASNEKDKKGSGVQNEVRVFLVACSWAERRAGTASAALSHPPPPPRRAGRTG